MSANFDFDLFDEMVKDAPTAGFGPQANFGKCTMSVNIMAWEGGKGDRKPKPRAFKAGETLNKDKGEYFQLEFEVDVHELNSQLENAWKRRVDIRKSGKNAPTDWTEIVEPSLLAVFGKDWSKKLGGKGVYVEVEAVDTVVIDPKTNLPKTFIAQGSGKEYTNSAPRFVRAFKSKAECEAARQERYAKKDDADIDMTAGDVPADVVSNVKGLFNAMSYEQALGYLDTKPFGAYSTDVLLKAAGIEAEDEEE